MAGTNSNQVQIGDNRFISKSVLLSHLQTYNLYYEEQSLQLRHREEEEELIIEGLLNISWGLRRPIRLQMQDGKEAIKSFNISANANLSKKPTITRTSPTDDVAKCEDQSEKYLDKGLESDLHRTKSCVSGRRLGGQVPSKIHRRIRRHRCSFNGHYYNQKTAVFTPAFGSVTNVRVNSSMTTSQVLRVLLSKFKIENSPDEFSLFLLHTSGERVQLKRDDHPLIIRVLQGPLEQICKIFLMEPDQLEEVTYNVAQYIKLEMPVLQSFIIKLTEEENKEMEKLKQRYDKMRSLIQKHMQHLADKAVC